MLIRIEFFGIARSRVGITACEIELAGSETTLKAALRELSCRFPALNPECIANSELMAAFTLNLNGERFVREGGTLLQDGDTLLFLSADAGG